MKVLRDYQEEATQATFDYFFNNKGNPLVIAPVAAGKSLLMAEFIRRACEIYAGTRILVLAHNKELLIQNAQELMGQWPDVSFGFYCAGLGQKKINGQVIFASIQSIYSKAFDHNPFDLVLVDECHLINSNQSGMYTTLFADLTVANPNIKIIGYTGTPYRPDSGLLIDGPLFDDVAYEIEIQYLIDQGFLCPPATPTVKTKMDAAGVATRLGDYVQGQLERAVDIDRITKSCVDEIIENGADRKSWLVFTCGVEHCKHVMEEIRSRGITCDMVVGDTPSAERDSIIKRFKIGEIKCLVNVAVLTTGFNHPGIDLIAFMRPTRSPVLYVQCVGRGMRLCPGKENVMILDFGGVIDELGPIDKINITKKKSGDGEGEAPVKQCSKCYAFMPAAAKECDECGFQFPAPEPSSIEARSAKDKAVLSSQIKPEWYDVLWMNVKKHEKPDKTPSMMVSYGTMQNIFREWICFEHKGYPRRKAERWYKDRMDDQVPGSIDEAINKTYPQPARISAIKTGKYWEIKGYEFKEQEEYEIPSI